jgi:hypothetical protein
LLLDMFGVAAPVFGAASLTFPRGHTDFPAIGPMTVGIPNRNMSFKGMIGLTGNFAWGGLAHVNGVYYIYPSDEWFHGGLSRWSCRGISTVTVADTVVAWNSGSYVPFNDPTDLLQGLPYASTNLPGSVTGWTRNPPTNQGPSQPIWTVHTNEIVADPHKSPDLAVFFSGGSVSYTMTKAIPRVGSGNWTINSRVYFGEGATRTGPGVAGNSEIFLDVLDNTGKIIVRVESYISGPIEGGLLVNNVKISTADSTGASLDWLVMCGAVRALVINYISSTGKIQVIYDNGTYSILDAGVFTVGAAPGSPATFRILAQGVDPASGASPVVVVTKLNYTEV